jgi:tetratricopeptide (TPR) repeat protein
MMASQDWRRTGWRFLAFMLLMPGIWAQGAAPPSDTDARIRFYTGRLGGPGTYPAYARLGAAYLQKGRETGQQSSYDAAAGYLLTSLRYQRNYEALLWLAAVQLARHEFREALQYAREAVATRPTHPSAQGVLFDSYLALGDLPQAEAVAKSMLSSQADSAYYARLATLREYRGDLTGAVEAMEKACSRLNAQTALAESRAWCEVRLGSLDRLARCEAKSAEMAYQRALELFPDYHRALEHLAELRAAQARHDEAIALYDKVVRATGDPTYRLMLADIYDEKGDNRTAEWERERALDQLRRSAQNGSRAYLRPLALLLLEQKATAVEGWHWARRDWEHRRDAFAADTLAWAHYQNGRTTEALEAMRVALRIGPPEGSVLLHAAVIYLSAKQRSQARIFLEQALLCPLTLRSANRAHAEKLLAELRNEDASR